MKFKRVLLKLSGESLAGSMDKGIDLMGIKATVNILNGFDKQLRIFVISHNPLLEEEIPDKIKISRDENGFSVINH